MHELSNLFFVTSYTFFMLLLEEAGMEYVLQIWVVVAIDTVEGRGLTASKVAKIIKETGDGVY